MVVKLVDNICFYVCFKYYYKSVHNNYFSPSGGENSDNLTDQDTVTESHQEIQEEIQKESSKESNEKSKEQSREQSHLESQEKSQDESHEVVNSVPPQDNLETTSLQPTTTKMSQYQELPRSSDNEGRNHQDLQVLLNILFFLFERIMQANSPSVFFNVHSLMQTLPYIIQSANQPVTRNCGES